MESDLPNDDQVYFQKPRHIKYWLRCLKTLLPTAYTSSESQRMTFAFFTLSALDILSALQNHTTADERSDYVDWIYSCQHPNGGFKGFTGASAGREHQWDPANLAATYFALASLIVLNDDFSRVKVSECLAWIVRLQRDDGSFGEAIGKGGRIEGSGDIRYCYLAASVRFILRRKALHASASDINVDGLTHYVRSSTTFEGGIAKAPFHEAHGMRFLACAAGWTYCGIGVLHLLQHPSLEHRDAAETYADGASSFDRQALLRWLVSRQTSFVSEDGEPEDDEDEDETVQEAPSFRKTGARPAASEPSLDRHRDLSVDISSCAGFNGRCNKIADSCYSFWVGASLAMMGHADLQDRRAISKYLLQKAQHVIGGFGKLAGDPPDILHSYLSLAALAIMKYPEINDVDPTLCISKRACSVFDSRFPIE